MKHAVREPILLLVGVFTINPWLGLDWRGILRGSAFTAAGALAKT
jgi:hypothetical protein